MRQPWHFGAFRRRFDVIHMHPKTKILIKSAADRFVSKSLSDKIYLRMCLRRFRAAKTIFIHIPKAAGTSVATATLGRRAGHFRASEIRAAMGREFDQFFKFTVVRNPFDRLYSAYSFARQGSTESGAVSNANLYQSDAFRSFESFVEEWLAAQDLSKLNVIFRPQSDFVFENGALLVDYVGKTETMAQVAQDLSRHLGRDIEIGHANRSGRSRDFMSVYSPTTLQVARRLYAADFENFGYA